MEEDETMEEPENPNDGFDDESKILDNMDSDDSAEDVFKREQSDSF